MAALRRPGETEPALRASSCPLLTLTPARVILSINWIPPNSMDIHINGNLLGSAEKPEDCPREHWLAGGAPSEGHTDFTQKNIAARKKRRETLAGIRPRIGKIPGGKERHFKALRAEVRQLADLLGLVRGGSTDHILGIFNRLRMTISMGKPLATLQLCAAHVDAPLMVYTSARPELPFPLKLPIDRFEFNLSAEPTAMLSNGVDIDVWLGLPGAQTEQAKYTNGQVLNAIGNTIGSHLSIDVHSLVSLLEKGWAPAGRNAELHDHLTRYLAATGEEVLRVSERLLNENASV